MSELHFHQCAVALGLLWLSICLQVWHHARRDDGVPGIKGLLFLRTRGPKIGVVILRLVALFLVFKT